MQYVLRTLTEYSDDAILAELRRVVASLNGTRLTIERYDRHGRVHSTTVRNRFGSWGAALDLAGIDDVVAPRSKFIDRESVLIAIRQFADMNPYRSVTRDAVAMILGVDGGSITRKLGKWELLLAEVGLNPVPLGRRYTDEECFENVLALWTHYGRQPHFAELKQPPSTVGSKAYVRRWGGWRHALAAFVSRVSQTNDDPSPEQSEPVAITAVGGQSVLVTPRTVSLSLRYKILLRDKFRCVCCGRSPAKDGEVELHVDHIKPWSRGGMNTEANLRTLCSQCNLGKGARLEEA